MFVPSPPTYTTTGHAAESAADAQAPTDDLPNAEAIAAPAEPPVAAPQEPAEAPPPASAASPGVAPPPLVIPSQVKYEP